MGFDNRQTANNFNAPDQSDSAVPKDYPLPFRPGPYMPPPHVEVMQQEAYPAPPPPAPVNEVQRYRQPSQFQEPYALAPGPAPYVAETRDASQYNPETLMPPHRSGVLDLGILRIGGHDGSAIIGVGIPGLVGVEGSLGRHTGVRAGAGLGPVVGAEAGAGVDFDRNGMHPGVDARGQALQLAGGHVGVGADIGSRLGAGGQVGAFAGPVESRVGAHAYLDQRGLDTGAGARANLADAIGVQGGGRVALNDNSRAHVGVGGYAGDVAGKVGVGVWSDGNRTVRPDAYADGRYVDRTGRVQLNPAVERPDVAARPARRDAIEVHELPPVKPERSQFHCPPKEATPENVRRMEEIIRQRVSDESVLTAKKGQSYLDIMQSLRPDAERSQLVQEANYMKRFNHNKELHEGSRVQSLTKPEIEWETKKALHKYFGWPPPGGK